MEEKQHRIAVLGDSCEDLFFKVDRIPQIGETLDAHGNYKSFGGKGANSAVAIGKLGYNVEILSQVGDDRQGRELKTMFEGYGVGTQCLKLVKEVGTGLGFIMQLKDGNNVVISIGGANTAYDPEMKELDPSWTQLIQSSKVLCLQRLIPDYVNVVAARIAKEAGVTVILDVGGMQANVQKELFQYLDYISPNETEVKQMLHKEVNSQEELMQEVETFIRTYPQIKVLLKEGDKGASIHYLDQSTDKIVSISRAAYKFEDFPPLKLTDTAGAGDCFTGAFACKILDGSSYEEALEFGNKVGFLCVSKNGTMPSVPSIADIEQVFGK